MPVKPAIIPCLRYANAPAAIDFLCRAFGFQRQAIYTRDGAPDIIEHAQLTWNGQMIMLASVKANDFSDQTRLKTVAEAGGPTQTIYVVIDDVDAHAARAEAEGAEIFSRPADQDYGGRLYSARDIEGNVWSFGSYDPWAEAAGPH